MTALVFVYGTLTDPGTASSVLEEFSYEGSARLVGLERVEGRYPTLVPGGSTDGRLLRTGDLDALDRYEGVEDGLYVRVSVPFAGDRDGSGAVPATVETYVGDPERLGVADEWPGDGPFEERVRAHCESTSIHVERS